MPCQKAADGVLRVACPFPRHSFPRQDRPGITASSVKLKNPKNSPFGTMPLRLIQSLREDCSIEDIQYYFYVLQKVEHCVAAIEAGQFVCHEEAKQRIADRLEPACPSLCSMIFLNV